MYSLFRNLFSSSLFHFPQMQTIRFREVLEDERVKRGERASKVTLSVSSAMRRGKYNAIVPSPLHLPSCRMKNGSEAPLSLKRTLSQSCDPHRAYILIELGSFEDTVGRINHQELDIPRGSLSSLFFYKVVAKVAVDTVGVHRYPLDRKVGRSSLQDEQSDSRSLGWLIVRVALQGGIKLVSVESPLSLKNDADADLLCEVRSHDSLSLLWRCLVPKPEERKRSTKRSNVPVDIVPMLNDKACEFTVEALPRDSHFCHESELGSNGGRHGIKIKAPRPFSHSSLLRGLIDEVDLTFQASNYPGSIRLSEQVHLNVCSLRIGEFDGSQVESLSSDVIPEQRMLLFRSPLAVCNYLAFPLRVQVRTKRSSGSNLLSTSSLDMTEYGGWEDLGVLDCGERTSWTGAVSSDEVEIRVQFVAADPETSRRFLSWSSTAAIPATTPEKRGEVIDGQSRITVVSKVRVLDTCGLPLDLSVATGGGYKIGDKHKDNIKKFSASLAPASRVVNIYVPFWILDSTGLDLEFSARSLVAGQFDSREDFMQGEADANSPGLTMGLAELLEDAKLSHLPSKSSFSILLIGDDRARKLSIRQRVMREKAGKGLGLTAPWSDPIHLRAPDNKLTDVTVMPPGGNRNSNFEPFALCTRVVSAPFKFGGKHGTKIVHVVCRYAIVNELGREIELIAEKSRGTPVLIRADGKPKPFHFDDSGPIQFRPKEFGWVWSGRFYIRADRREVTLRIRHKLKQQTMIVNAEFHSKKQSGTCMIVFRSCSHPPFRFENNTVHPLQFVQTYLSNNENDILYNREVESSETILLPFMSADYSWDEPEHRRKSVQFEVADFGNKAKSSVLGRFNLDRIAPGTELKMDSSLFVCHVIADGPTRVIRISESSIQHITNASPTKEVRFGGQSEGNHVTFIATIKLTHGLGVSIVDWSPQELLFLRFEEIQVTNRVDSTKETIEASIGRISVDNQLWISPYPVLLEMGSRKLASTLAHIARRKNRRHRAVSLSVCRPLISTGIYGDLTLLEWLELVTDPISVYIDGNLALSLSRLMQQVIDMGAEGDASLESRNATLCKLLSISESSDAKRKITMGTADIYSAGDDVTTAATAARARSNRANAMVKDAVSNSTVNIEGQPGSDLSKGRAKFYIERLKISTTKLDISWSGSLPFLSLQGRIPLSLTFEGFPLLLRPYSSSHAYGTVDDHLQSLKSHYLSFWRIVDLLLGLASKPTFLIQAVVYTWSESTASALASLSRRLAMSRENLLLAVRETTPKPIYEDRGTSATSESLVSMRQETSAISESRVSMRQRLSRPFVQLLASYLQYWIRFTGFGAALFRYDPTKFSRHRKVGLVRTRNPRLFANVDGKDLLVEYSEGENAGKALLSRIRMGMHLGEGYIFHIEGIYQKAHVSWAHSSAYDPSNLILMITFERIVIVSGDLNVHFCSVVWEVTFDNLIQVESVTSEDPGFSLFTIWYLANPLHERKKGDEHMMSRYAKSLVGDPDSGMDNLRCTHVYVPHGQMEVLVAKAKAAKKML